MRWKKYCIRLGCNPVLPNLSEALDFLAEMFQDNYQYSAINTARSALSAVLGTFDGVPFGQHNLVVRMMKGVFNARPPQARYATSWDVSIVLAYLKRLSPVRELSLKDLTIKLCMLLALVTGQRCQTIHALDLKCLKRGPVYVFKFEKPLKHSRAHLPAPTVELKPFPPDRRLCVLTVLKEYITRTSTLRGDNTRLLLSYIKPHKPVTRESVSRWVKLCLVKAGIDTDTYSAHSTRMAATSKAAFAQLPLKTVMEAAGWTSAGTFQKFYHRTVTSFADTVLS